MAKIYLIGDEKYDFEQTSRALNEDVDMFQLRLKNASSKAFYEQAKLYKKLCHDRGIKFIINDRVDIALAVDADGLHIGQDDLPYEPCCALFADKIIGLSVGNEKEAKEAFELGVDYIGLGAMYATSTKKNAKVIGIEALERIKRSANCPIVAIGGINSDNFQAVYDGGADMLAVSSAILNHKNPEMVLKVLRGEG